MARFRALVAAVELVGAQGHDLDAVLNALAEQARRLLGADAATVLLAGSDGMLTVRRPNPLAEPGTPLRVTGGSVDIGPFTREAIERRRAVVATDFQQDDRPRPEDRAMLRRINARVVAPLFTRDVLQGVLVLDWLVPHTPTRQELEIAEALGAHAAVAIRGAQLVADAQARATRLETARRVSAVAAEAGDLDGLLRRLLSEALRVVGALRGQVALVDSDGTWVRGRVGYNLDAAVIEATVRRIYDAPHPDEDVYALVVRTGTQEIVDDSHPGVHRPTFERYGLPGGLRVITPIRHQGRTAGVIGIWYERSTRPSDEELAVLRLIGEQAGSVVVRAHLLDEAERARSYLASVLDADGRVSAANAAARHQLVPPDGDGSAALDSLPRELIERALRGDRVAEEVVWTARDGQAHRAHVIIVPIPNAAGGVLGGVAVARDVTALHAVTVQRAQLDAAVMTARTIAHELNQGLQLLTTYCELLAVTGGGTNPPLVDSISKTVDRLADTVVRFQRIARFQSVATPVGPALDLAAATTPPLSPEPP